MLQHPGYTRERFGQLIYRLREKIYPEKVHIEDLLVSSQTGRISHAEAQQLEYKPAKLGEQLGPQWATYWVKARAVVPQAWEGRRVDLLWDSHCEATLWVQGRTMQGLNTGGTEWGGRPDAVLLPRAHGGEKLEFEIEVACNGMFGGGNPGGFRHLSPFMLDQCDLALFDEQAWELFYDVLVLQQLEAEQEKDLDKAWGGELLYELNRAANVCDPDDRATWPEAQRILKQLYTRRNGTQVHELSATGHAHMDTAWLWPLAETWRKCERTFSSQLAYMAAYPEYKFACSQAYQYAAIKAKNPELYQRICEAVKRGQFVPVGGTWIEADCNIPSGEALARQFLHGQRFFQKEFGITCREFWNPDVFGYNGQLPQLMRLSGITRFLTQKLCWNRFNKPPHHTFNWQGIDGSEVLAHFPPADTYGATCTIQELRNNVRNYKENDRSRHSYLLFGYGDGGGGPTKHMLEMLKRVRDLQGVPRTQMRNSNDFFELLEKDCTDRPVVVGELYFELHRGTYTTQALTKKNNRKNEFLLHDLEFLATTAHRRGALPYPAEDLDRAWKLLLLNQFHDILPGSSITLVYEDTTRQHQEIRNICEPLRKRAVDTFATANQKTAALTPVNSIGVPRREVAAQPNGKLAYVDCPSYGVGQAVEAGDQATLTTTADSQGDIILENGHLRVVVAPDGTLLSLVEKHSGRESLAGPANVFQLFDDNKDAWDIEPYHLETVKDCPPAKLVSRLEQAPLRVGLCFERQIGRASRAKQTISLSADARRLEFHTEVDWHESNKMLKVAFPVVVRAMNATYEMQFGCVERPTHYNSTYDLAKYEVPGHKWADLSEHGFGVALLTDCKYGYSTFGNLMRISLLRSPKSPDPEADMGRQQFSYAVMPHVGGWRESGVVAESLRFNVPVLWAQGTAQPQSFFSMDDPNLVIDTVKKAEDSDAIIVRMYETHGGRGVGKLTCALPFASAVFCNILEKEGESATLRDGTVEIPYAPYKVISVKLK